MDEFLFLVEMKQGNVYSCHRRLRRHQRRKMLRLEVGKLNLPKQTSASNSLPLNLNNRNWLCAELFLSSSFILHKSSSPSHFSPHPHQSSPLSFEMINGFLSANVQLSPSQDRFSPFSPQILILKFRPLSNCDLLKASSDDRRQFIRLP